MARIYGRFSRDRSIVVSSTSGVVDLYGLQLDQLSHDEAEDWALVGDDLVEAIEDAADNDGAVAAALDEDRLVKA